MEKKTMDAAKKLTIGEKELADFDLKGFFVLLKILRLGTSSDPLLGLPPLNLGFVLKIGDEAYDDKAFPGGPRCKEGDTVYWYSQFDDVYNSINDQEYVFVLDTSIIGVAHVGIS